MSTHLSKIIVICLGALVLVGCTETMAILDGATHAKGTLHIEGPFTDSQGDVALCKVPEDYTPEQAAEYCHGE